MPIFILLLLIHQMENCIIYFKTKILMKHIIKIFY